MRYVYVFVYVNKTCVMFIQVLSNRCSSYSSNERNDVKFTFICSFTKKTEKNLKGVNSKS